MKSRTLWALMLLTTIASCTTMPNAKLNITSTEDYPGVYGPDKIEYEIVTGTYTGELDPADSHNAIITDIRLADKNNRGLVEYTSDFFMIKPKNMDLSNGILRYDAPNRGNAFNSHPDSILMARGYVFISAAWQGDVDQNAVRGMPPGFFKLFLDVPVAHNSDGSEITGPIRVEFAPPAGTHPSQMPLCGNVYNSGHVTYTPASFPDNTGCILTKRMRENDPRRVIPNSEWAFASTGTDNPFPGTPDSTLISLKEGFNPDYLYELIYTGKDPKVMGIGLAAIRDIVTFFRDAEADGKGQVNPVAGKIKYTIGTGTSQSGNFMKTFIHLGFNENCKGNKVFDAVFPIVGARQTNINMRFAVPGGGGGPRTEHKAFGQTSVRAFASDYVDDISGNQGGIFARSKKSNTTPKVFMLLTSSEMWALQASAVFTDAYGLKDLVQPENLRIYYIAGAQHSVGLYGPVRWNPESTLYPGSTMVDGNGIQRALWIALEEWVVQDIAPPASEMPSIEAGTLVFPEELQFPSIRGLSWDVRGRQIPVPDFEYRCIINNLNYLDFGPDFNEFDESGITTLLPPACLGKDYAIMVSQIDEDGNETAGILTPELQAPLGTNLGFNYITRTYLEDLSGLSGSFLPFHKTKASRLAAGDTRLSLEERYGNHQGYVNAVVKAAQQLVDQRLLLQEDAEQIIEKAKNTTVF